MIEEGDNKEATRKTFNNKDVFSLVGLVVVVVVVFLLFTLSSPKQFPTGSTLTIDEGALLKDISSQLEEEKYVRSAFWFETILRMGRFDAGVKAGSYQFTKPVGTIGMMGRLVNGEFGLENVRVTLPEGSTRKQMAEILDSKFQNFDTETFMKVTLEKEGYLFPDTYLFLPDAKAETIAVHLEDTFFKKVNSIEGELIDFGRSLEEIIIMASIIEKEVSDTEDQLLVSGVLWKRLSIGMALQVDAPFLFFLGKGSAELTLEDLKIDSPYNTYLYQGLPPGPIGNPGLSAIRAALTPQDSEYLFYLSDSQGVTHYAEDFEGHKRNKALYLGG